MPIIGLCMYRTISKKVDSKGVLLMPMFETWKQKANQLALITCYSNLGCIQVSVHCFNLLILLVDFFVEIVT